MRVVRAPCMGGCHNAPVAAIGHALHEHATVDSVDEGGRQAATTHPPLPAYRDFAAYRADGGYKLLEACLAGKVPLEDILKTLEDSQISGLGGAGFPTGRKWRFVRAEPKPRLMAVNADEGEPGTFKDRVLSRDRSAPLPRGHADRRLGRSRPPTSTSICATSIRNAAPCCSREIAEARGRRPDRSMRAIHLRRGAGAYICGEESAMLESIEGKRGLPRHKPPFPSQVGLFGRPTLINNVETLYWVRDIVEQGAGMVRRAKAATAARGRAASRSRAGSRIPA